jgi:hypothetical protein
MMKIFLPERLPDRPPPFSEKGFAAILAGIYFIVLWHYRLPLLARIDSSPVWGLMKALGSVCLTGYAIRGAIVGRIENGLKLSSWYASRELEYRDGDSITFYLSVIAYFGFGCFLLAY